MRLTVPKGELCLPEDFSIQLEFKHPFYSNEGASSLPVSLPASQKNLRLLDFPDLPNRTHPLTLKYPAILSHGTFQLAGELLVSNISIGDSIECVFITRESAMYSGFADKKLEDLFRQKKTDFAEGAMIENLWAIYTAEDYSDNGLAVFPVTVTADECGFSIVNEVNEDETGFTCPTELSTPEGDIRYYPDGFGLSPFLYLWKLLELTFTLGGYKVKYNIFTEVPYCHLVVLNNCVDACVGSQISYSDLVPSISVGELLLWLKDKFGAYVVHESNSVSIHLISKENTDYDFSKYAVGDESVSYPEKKHLVINCDTSLEGAAPPIDSGIDKFLKDNSDFWRIGLLNEERFYGNGLEHPTGPVYPILSVNDLKIMKGARLKHSEYSFIFKISSSGSMAFPYSREHDAEAEERKTKDVFCPIGLSNGNIRLFIGAPICRHTVLTSSNGETLKEEANCTQALALCWCFKRRSGKGWFGTTSTIDEDGVHVDDFHEGKHFPLTPDGIYHMFWREYNQMLLRRCPEISVKLSLPEDHIVGLDFSKRKLLNGKSVILKSLSVAISSRGVEVQQAKFTSITGGGTINDKDMYGEPGVCLEWKHINNVPSILDHFAWANIIDGLSHYTEDDKPSYSPGAALGDNALLRLRKGRLYQREEIPVNWLERFVLGFKD